MPTVIKADIFDPECFTVLSRELDDWQRNVLSKQVDDYTMVVAQDVIEDIQAAEHFVTGRLKDNTDWHDMERVGPAHFRIEIDPVDPRTGKHYAQTERHRESRDGIDHDFVEKGMRNVKDHIEEWKGLFN